MRAHLDAHADASGSCAAREAPLPASTRKYFVLGGGAEQMHKNNFVVSDALFIPRSLGRVLLEPAVAHSHLATANETLGLGGRRLYLRHYYDLTPLCARFELLRPTRLAAARRRELLVTAAVVRARGGGHPGSWRLHTTAAVRAAFAHAEGARLLVLEGAWRSLPNDERALRDEGAPLPYEGVALTASVWEPNAAYAPLARLVLGATSSAAAAAGAVGGLLAVQWRSEDWQYNLARGGGGGGGGGNVSDPSSLLPCARAAAASINRALRAKGPFAHAFLATDLRAGASGSYAGVRSSPARNALRVLEAAVPALRNGRRRALLAATGDRGVAACLESAIAVGAAFALATTERCDDCERARRCSKMSSAFGRALVARRLAYDRPSAPLF